MLSTGLHFASESTLQPSGERLWMSFVVRSMHIALDAQSYVTPVN